MSDMNINDVYAGTLNAGHLNGSDATVTITGGEIKQYDDKRRVALNLAEYPNHPLVLNKTNAVQIAATLGTPEVTAWKGRQVTLYATTTTYQGRTVACIRVREQAPPANTPAPQQGPQTYRF